MLYNLCLLKLKMQALRGTGWVLMDGRDVTGSQYAEITGETTLPDARGVFLRSKNNGRADGNEDQDGERTLGSIQNDKTRRPRDANFSGSISASAGTAGTHSHQLWTNRSNSGNNNNAPNYTSSGLTGETDGSESYVGSNTADNLVRRGGAHSHSVSGSSTMTSGGDPETRPKNVAINTFIKIN
jgi:hypothetical protein